MMHTLPPSGRRSLLRQRSRTNTLCNSNKIYLVCLKFIIIFAFITIVLKLFTFTNVMDENGTTFVNDRGNLRGGAVQISNYAVFDEGGVASAATHLIVVAGHSVTLPTLPTSTTDRVSSKNYFEKEEAWILEPYQKGKGLPQAILGHISAGIELARQDEDSLLLFSGGETRPKIGPISEGSSYFRVADALNLWDKEEDLTVHNPGHSSARTRTTIEDYATDSFENLLFSICRFYEVTGSYPTKITMVSFSFKEARFRKLHAPALLWPDSAFEYVGVDPPSSTGFNLQDASNGESMNSVKPFEGDPYGCSSPILQEKRHRRNPFKRKAPYEMTCPQMRELLNWCGPSIFSGNLPWKLS